MACGPRSDRALRRMRAARFRFVQLRAGVTLLEVIVVVAVMAVAVTVAGLSWRTHEPPVSASAAVQLVAAARREALKSGSAVTVRVELTTGVHVITVTPDGRIRGGEAVGFDALAGQPVQQEDDEARASVESALTRTAPEE